MYKHTPPLARSLSLSHTHTGTNDRKLIEILGHRTLDQRLAIRKAYETEIKRVRSCRPVYLGVRSCGPIHLLCPCPSMCSYMLFY